MIVPGYREVFDRPPEPALEALRAAADRGARIASICTGAFALAHAGLLDGRRATTHWFSAGELAARFPAIEVDPDALYVEDGPSSPRPGSRAGIDLCLHLVRSDHGERIGARVARAMVAAPHRDGGQAQFIERAAARATPTARSRRCARWALDHLDRAARRRHPRRPRRRQPAHLRPPLRRRDRDDAAQVAPTPSGCSRPGACSSTPTSTSSRSPPRAGFGSAPSLREHFRRATATTPTAYRRAFAPA